MKRLVICADGTWNVRDQADKNAKTRRPTNVTKVARAVRSRDAHGLDQVVIYHDGVGTSGGLDRITGGAFGDGIENNVRSLYRSILYNYCPGDELFLFGFSRGAFTVRTLLGFINLVGLVDKADDYWLPEIYGCYQQGLRPGSAGWDSTFAKFEHPPQPAPPVKFIGVWDTVGALGAPGFLGQMFNGKKYAYHDISLNDNIQHAYQALALHEHRRPFLPSVWSAPPSWGGTLVQAWFVGAHSDIGGGEARDGLANEALHWLVEKAERLGLEVDSAFLLHFKPCFNGDYHDSMTLAYRLLGTVTRPLGTATGGTETVHQAVLDRLAMTPPVEPAIDANITAAFHGAAPENTTRIARGTPC
jgi:uncharacterized protein (DUF2235 family)